MSAGFRPNRRNDSVSMGMTLRHSTRSVHRGSASRHSTVEWLSGRGFFGTEDARGPRWATEKDPLSPDEAHRATAQNDLNNPGTGVPMPLDRPTQMMGCVGSRWRCHGESPWSPWSLCWLREKLEERVNEPRDLHAPPAGATTSCATFRRRRQRDAKSWQTMDLSAARRESGMHSVQQPLTINDTNH
jgi:hypothetical protein